MGLYIGGQWGMGREGRKECICVIMIVRVLVCLREFTVYSSLRNNKLQELIGEMDLNVLRNWTVFIAWSW